MNLPQLTDKDIFNRALRGDEVPKDILGKIIKTNDYLAYPSTASGSAILKIAKVLRIYGGDQIKLQILGAHRGKELTTWKISKRSSMLSSINNLLIVASSSELDSIFGGKR